MVTVIKFLLDIKRQMSTTRNRANYIFLTFLINFLDFFDNFFEFLSGNFCWTVNDKWAMKGAIMQITYELTSHPKYAICQILFQLQNVFVPNEKIFYLKNSILSGHFLLNVSAGH